MSIGRLATSTASAWARATSAPCPIASETSARASTGASLTPSPIMATRSPRACAAATSSSLPCGVAPPHGRVHLQLPRQRCARAGLSPDSRLSW